MNAIYFNISGKQLLMSANQQTDQKSVNSYFLVINTNSVLLWPLTQKYSG